MDAPHDREFADTLRVLAAQAGPVPRGLASRVYDASVLHLPHLEVIGRVGPRTTPQWRAAAAVLILAGGAILAWQASLCRDAGHLDERTLSAVVEASANSSEDESFIGLASARGARFSDLAFEMHSVLNAGQAGR
jgi:hypothetical protein